MTASKSSVLDSTLNPEALEAESRVAFPKLSEAQTERIGRIAKTCEFADGGVLWAVGDRAASFFVVVKGAVDIRQPIPARA